MFLSKSDNCIKSMSCTIFLFHMVYGHGFRCGFMLSTDLFFSSFEGNRFMMIFSSSGHKNEGFSESFTDGRFVVEIQLVTHKKPKIITMLLWQ